jgi:lipopolysaccharide transport system ATP-binding protein
LGLAMSDLALRTIGLGKMYHIGAERERNPTLRDAIVRASTRPIERVRHPGAATHRSQDLWALKDVNLEVKPGEVLGIIGRNGAGKSTLLKVLSHITEPTEGRVEIRGRVGSLLEVGTGFHPELTGRENIQLNGAILGMTRAEIKSKFDEIVEFSEIGRFLDTPVKRYSSGMYVRLAFAVAAHLEPEILIVDEVLAVGDAGFQKKCLGKMEDVAGHGRTVLFVSHNMQAVQALCSRAVLLEAGLLTLSGDPHEVVGQYLGNTELDLVPEHDLREAPRTRGSGDVRIVSIRLAGLAGEAKNVFAVNEPLVFELRLECSSPFAPQTALFLLLRNRAGNVVASSFEYDSSVGMYSKTTAGSFTVGVMIDSIGLTPDIYTASIGAFGVGREFLDWVDHALSFEVQSVFWDGRPFDHRLGEVFIRGLWQRP